MQPVSHVLTDDPLGVALRNMGRAARQAGGTFTVQEWANRLATRAGPRDYVGQLGELYKGIIDRWRYVMEPGERVPGSASAVLRYTLGAKYNKGPTCPDPLRCDVEGTNWKHKGWGDCDDVSALTAAGVLALGMTPVFRVVRWPNGAHVSVLARTPQGRMVSIDPVGHPKEEFGWAMDPPGSSVLTFDLDGRQLGGSALGAEPMGTYLAGVDRITAKRSTAPHLVSLHPLSPQGPRFLAVPRRVQHAMLLGYVVDKAPAVDQYGQRYEYVAGADMWSPLDGRRSRRRARRKKRRAQRRGARMKRRTVRRKKIKRFVKRVRRGVAKVARSVGRSKVARFFRKIKSKILGSKLVQGLISKGLQIFGVPPAATKALLQREAALAKAGGRSKLIELLADGKGKEAARMIGRSFKGAIRGAAKGLSAKISAMGAVYDEQHGGSVVCNQGGASFPVAYVSGFYSANQMLGAVDEMDVSPTPEPGAWYQVKKGDNLLGIAQAAYGKSGRLGSAQRINAAPYNGRFWQAPKGDFNSKYFPDGIVGLLPRYPEPNTQRLDEADGGEFDGGTYPAIWIPSEAKPDAPPLAVDEPEEVEPEPLDPEEDEPEIVDPTPERPAPPDDCTGGGKFPGFEPVWTEPFFDVNKSPPGMNPGGWSCRPGSGPAPAPVQPAPEPSPEEPPAPAPAPLFPPIPPGIREPLCPPGQEAFWPSGHDGFGPHACRPEGFVPSQPQPQPQPQPEPEPSPEEPPIVYKPDPVPWQPPPQPQPSPGGGRALPAPLIAALMALVSGSV